MAMAQWELRETPPAAVQARAGHGMVLAGHRLHVISGQAG